MARAITREMRVRIVGGGVQCETIGCQGYTNTGIAPIPTETGPFVAVYLDGGEWLRFPHAVPHELIFRMYPAVWTESGIRNADASSGGFKNRGNGAFNAFSAGDREIKGQYTIRTG